MAIIGGPINPRTGRPLLPVFGGGSASIAPLIASVDSVGWSAQWASGTPPTFAPDTSPSTVIVSRQGFDSSGSATTLSDTLTYLTRTTQAYPNYGTPTAATVALSDYVYPGDVIAGVTNNNTTEASPKPGCFPSHIDRLRIGNTVGGLTVPVTAVGHHRDARFGKPLACVKFIITDSASNSITVTVPTQSVTLRTGLPAILEYVLPTTDISSLANGLITVNQEHYPHFGGSTSVARSATDGNPNREFSPRYFVKTTDPTTYCYVASTGNNTTGVASTSRATAAANPCLTVMGAKEKIQATDGKLDNGEINIVDTVDLGTSSVNSTQNAAGLLVVPAPGVSTATAVINITTAVTARIVNGITIPNGEASVIFRGITQKRSANVLITGSATNRLVFQYDGSVCDYTGVTGTTMSNGADFHVGTTFLNLANNSLGEAGTMQRRGFKHVTGDFNGTGGLFGQFVIGSIIDRPIQFTLLPSNTFFAFNRLIRCANSVTFGAAATTNTLSNFMLIGNVLEFTSATTNPIVRVSADAGTESTNHVVIHNNTIAGASGAGRWNAFYDETQGGVRRTHKMASIKGNLGAAFYIKSSQFLGTNGNGSPDPTNAPFATGNWAINHGVGCAGNVFLYQSATALGGTEAQYFPGLNCSYGTQINVPTQANAAVWTSYQGTTVTSGGVFTAGAGNGDYTLANGSIAKARLANPVLAFDIAGNARSSTIDAAGAYA